MPHYPVFITGHWRSGTTVLHEAFACEPALACPTTYDCLADAHFLVSHSWIAPWLQYLVPARRPLDSAPFGLACPREDEFALCVLGVPSPYLDLILHTHTPQYDRYITLRDLDDVERAAWANTWCGFLNALTLKYQRRLVLKSPLHTCRLATILHVFPQARIVHVVRDPRAVVPSTMRLWEYLQRRQGLQRAYHGSWEDRVINMCAMMNEEFERTRHVLARVPHAIVRYEDFCREPLNTMTRIYDAIQLPHDNMWETRLRPWAERVLTLTPMRYDLSSHLTARIERTCADFMRTCG